MKPSIFVVEDDPDISRLVRHHLENDGFSVRVYPTGATVIADAERQRPALFVLDIMVPGKDGLELCRTIRQTSALASVPVIFLTAKSSEADRVLGLELGADDYIAKPFSPRELQARIRAILRRARAPAAAAALRFGRLAIDRESRTVRVDGEEKTLTSYQFDLLAALADNAGRVLNREQLLDLVKGEELEAFDRSIDVHVSRIRAAIEDDPKRPRRIITVRGAGYVFAKKQDGES